MNEMNGGFATGRRVLVAGGAGFIGSHLCEALARRGDRVVCIDNFQTGLPENLERIVAAGACELIEQDILDPIPARLKVDAIYNLACAASPPRYQADPIHTMLTSVVGVNRLLEHAGRCSARFLQASTSEVYGDPQEHPQRESYWGNVNPTGPRACYDEGKRAGETLCFDYQRLGRADVRVARIFNTYGPRMRFDDGRIVSNLVCQALRGKPLTIYGRGEQTRSFCYVSDLVRGLVALMEAPEAVVGPVNLGNSTEITINELANMVLALTGSGSAIAYRPLPADDPQRRRPDIAKAERLLGWRPEVSIADGLPQTVRWFERALGVEARALCPAEADPEPKLRRDRSRRAAV